ncbi:phage head-tail connector protein [Nocardioides stalactiti]|uniref:phage head-tail connector protein n=1 Tax=Nocardioides stalactiti TaxID=2755356 RepID=UPI001602C0E3|nr:phage head-tail connector protein [Nocardioides stalactiti]
MSTVSLDAVKVHLNIPADKLTHDTELQVFIDAAESAIGERVGPLAAVERTVRITPYPRTLRVPSPAAAFTAVVDADGSAVAVADLRVDAASGLAYYLDGSAFTSRWYDVTYMHGYDPCPADLVLAVKEMVRHLWATQTGPARRPGSTASNEMSNTVPGAAFMFPFRVSQLIAPHMPQLVG